MDISIFLLKWPFCDVNMHWEYLNCQLFFQHLFQCRIKKIALLQRMTDFCQTISLSHLSETLVQVLFSHRTALRLYGVIEIQPLRGC